MKIWNNPTPAVTALRVVGIIEGLSYIVLLAICMPLKYIFKMPKPVMINGWLHGVLFVTYGVLLLMVWYQQKWKFSKFLAGGVTSLIPFGTFWFDKKIAENKASL
jgi:integral membrane protein